MKHELTHISLFSGIGCSDIAAEWVGFETVLLCEIDRDCQKVLRKYWPNIPLIEDVRNVTRESVITYTTGNQNDQRGCGELAEATARGQGSHSSVSTSNQSVTNARLLRPTQRQVKTVGSKQYNSEPLTLLTAGVPCQPASSAGKRRGKADDRWLWPQAIRVLSELQPTWACFENPVGIASLVESGEAVSLGSEADQADSAILSVELSNICADIEKEGYEVQPVSISACSIGAPHKRQRIFIIAHSKAQRGERYRYTGREPEGNGRTDGLLTELGSFPGWQENWVEVAQRLCSKTQPGIRSLDARSTTGLLGLSRVAKLKMLGNANPPQMYYPIYKAIAEIESQKKSQLCRSGDCN